MIQSTKKSTYTILLRLLTLSLAVAIALPIAAQRRRSRQPEQPQIDLSAIPDTLERQVELTEVVVKPKKQRYSKRNNPAVDFVKKIRNMSSENDPLNEPFYSYDKYERLTLAFNNIDDSIGTGRSLLRQFKFLNEYVDTSEITGKPILPLSVKEKISRVMNSNKPSRHHEVVTAMRSNGLDDFYGAENMDKILSKFFMGIDLYKNDIPLLAARFVSPLAAIGPDFYKYYLTDTVTIDDTRCIVLAFAPRNPASMGFTGRLYVPEGDTTMFIRRAVLNMPPQANVNYVESMRIEQNFVKDSLGRRILVSDNLAMELGLIPGMDAFYVQKLTSYTNHSFDEPDDVSLLDRPTDASVRPDAWLQPDSIWGDYRPAVPQKGQDHMNELMQSFRNVHVFYWTEKVIKTLVVGYFPITKGDKVELGPINTFVSFNDVEGARLRLGGMTTANLNKRWFARGFGAYGIRDKKWKYYAELEYSFRDKKRHSREFPMHSIRLSHTYNLDKLGQKYNFTSSDNIFLSLKRLPDTLVTYRRDTKLEYNLELENHFSVLADATYSRQFPSKYIGFKFADGYAAPHFDTAEGSLSLRYAPGENFVQNSTNRVYVKSDAPVFQLKHTVGRAYFPSGKRLTINRTDASVRARFWLSAFGYCETILKGAHIWGPVPFTALIIPNANLSYTIQPESYALLSAMEFMLDSYVALDFTYFGNGILFNQIPLVKKLKLREVCSFRGFWGTLSDRNNPAIDKSLPMFPADANPVAMKAPYMEISAGIDNILTFMRLDYVWRLSYLNTPGVDKHGLRLALHFAF